MRTSQGVAPVVTPTRTDGPADETLTEAACEPEMAIPHSHAMKTKTSTVVRWMSALVTLSLNPQPMYRRSLRSPCEFG